MDDNLLSGDLHPLLPEPGDEIDARIRELSCNARWRELYEGAGKMDTIFGGNDLSSVIGLETVEHRGPSVISIETVFFSKGNISEVFLRGVGVPENFITYMSSLVGRAIEFYSCFISYSSKNQQFANRLHADLQSKGVRCWLASEDLKIGDKTRPTLDESIRRHE